jgi:hypothetical protein
VTLVLSLKLVDLIPAATRIFAGAAEHVPATESQTSPSPQSVSVLQAEHVPVVLSHAWSLQSVFVQQPVHVPADVSQPNPSHSVLLVQAEHVPSVHTWSPQSALLLQACRKMRNSDSMSWSIV